MIGRLCSALFALGLVGCPADPCEGTEGIAPTLEIGEGPDGFERPLADGDAMTAEFGPQGGFHVWPAVRTTGFAPGRPGGPLAADRDAPTFEVVLREGSTPLESVSTTLAMDGTGASAELALFRLPVPESPLYDVPTSAPEPAFVLQIEGSDVCGNEVADEVTVRIDLGY